MTKERKRSKIKISEMLKISSCEQKNAVAENC